MIVDSVLTTIINLHREKKWQDILEFRQKFNHVNFDWCKLLWVWPNFNDLQFIAHNVKKFHLNEIVSIGCGTGLFEWLLEKSSGVSVTGIEIDEAWWNSSYSAPTFIPLKYTKNEQITTVGKSAAILFCYFNNEPAFQEYVDKYEGNLIIIIGPGPGRGTHTNPTPFSPNFGSNSSRWLLQDSREIGDGTKDFIAFYKKI